MNKQEKIVKGILGLGILLVMLMVATGSVSGAPACVADDGTGAFFCGDTVTESCTLNATMTCSGTHGLIIDSDDITIEGYNATDTAYYGITGNNAAGTYGIYNYNSAQGYGYDNVSINNLNISGFANGIKIQGNMNEDTPYACVNKVENNTVYNCTVHDNYYEYEGDKYGFGIHLYKCVCNSTIDKCEVYNTSGKLWGDCDDAGAGIRLWGKCNHNNVTNNTVHHNDLAGIYSKKGGGDCYNRIFNNTVYENGQTGADADFTGGIRFQCKSTDDNTFENNTVTNNTGPGIFIGGNDCILRNNTVTGNKDANNGANSRGDGLRNDRYADGGGDNTQLYDNRFCYNEHLDINVESAAQSVTGDDNTCNTTSNYDDTGTKGCTYCCLKAAYRYQVNANPPTACNVPSTEFTGKPYLSGQYFNISADDDLKVTDKTSGTGNNAAHRFNFSIDKDMATIDNITITWIGRGWHDSLTDGANLSIWNFTSGAYKLLNASANIETEVTLTGEVNTTHGTSNYINAGNITVLVEQKSAQSARPSRYSHIETDYVELEVKRS